MKIVNKTVSSFKNLKLMELLLFVLLVLYLLTNVATPYSMAPYVNNGFMYASLFALVILLFLYSNPLLALFFGFVVLVFINRSRKVDHSVLAPSQENKTSTMEKLNVGLKDKTLEEEMVGEIVKKPDNTPGPSSYNPVLCDSHNASSI